MAFVDIFNFKKYITKPSDAATARIGHVNAVYDALSAAAPVDIPTIEIFTGDSPTLTSKTVVFDMKINLSGPPYIPEAFDVYHPDITEDSIVRTSIVFGYTQGVAAQDISLTPYIYSEGRVGFVYATDGTIDTESGDIVKFYVEIIR